MNKTNVLNTMKNLKYLFTSACLLLFVTASNAQQPSLLALNDLTPKGIDKDDWSFFYDSENEIYYIDFETVNMNLTQVKMVDLSGKELISDKVADLPVNTIYELDCSSLENGNYFYQLKTDKLYSGQIILLK